MPRGGFKNILRPQGLFVKKIPPGGTNLPEIRGNREFFL